MTLHVFFMHYEPAVATTTAETFRNLWALLKEYSGILTEELLRRFQGTLGKHLTGIPRMLVGILHKNGIISSKDFRTVLKDLQCNVWPCCGHIPASNSPKAVRNILRWLRKTRLNYFWKSLLEQLHTYSKDPVGCSLWTWDYNLKGLPDAHEGLPLWCGMVLWWRSSIKLFKSCEEYSGMASGSSGEPFQEIFVNPWDSPNFCGNLQKVPVCVQMMWFLRGLCSLEHWGDHQEDSLKDYEFLYKWILLSWISTLASPWTQSVDSGTTKAFVQKTAFEHFSLSLAEQTTAGKTRLCETKDVLCLQISASFWTSFHNIL